MKFSIKQNADGVHIDASVGADQQQKLLEEFAKCANGTCSCRSPEYEKLQAMKVAQNETGIAVDLQARPGETLDQSEIERCLEHTSKLIEG